MFFTTQGRKKTILPSKEGKAKIAVPTAVFTLGTSADTEAPSKTATKKAATKKAAPTALNSSDTTAETEAPFKTAIKKTATKKAAPTTDLNSSDTTAGTEATVATTAAITENDQIIYASREMAIVAIKHQELNSCNIIL